MSSARIECGFCFTALVTGFCENCKYRLCETCSKNHPRVDMFKNHNVVQNEDFTNPKEKLDLDIHERKCKIHTDEKTALYCDEHDVCLCACCLLLKHKDCICSTIHLGNVVCDTEVLKKYISKLNEMEEQSDSIALEIEENLKLIAELRSKCEKDIDTFYDELIIKLKELKITAETEIAHKYQQNTEHLENVLVSCNENRERIRQQIKHIGEFVQKRHDRHLFITLKRKDKTTDAFLCSNQQCRIDNHVTKLNFARNSELEEMFDKDTITFGKTIDVCEESEEDLEPNIEMPVYTKNDTCTQTNVADLCEDEPTIVDKDMSGPSAADFNIPVERTQCKPLPISISPVAESVSLGKRIPDDYAEKSYPGQASVARRKPASLQPAHESQLSNQRQAETLGAYTGPYGLSSMPIMETSSSSQMASMGLSSRVPKTTTVEKPTAGLKAINKK